MLVREELGARIYELGGGLPRDRTRPRPRSSALFGPDVLIIPSVLPPARPYNAPSPFEDEGDDEDEYD
jgi:hypothetical protein